MTMQKRTVMHVMSAANQQVATLTLLCWVHTKRGIKYLRTIANCIQINAYMKT